MESNDLKYQFLRELISVLSDNSGALKILHVMKWSDDGWSLPGSSSDPSGKFEIFYFISGVAYLQIDGKDFTANPGDVFFVDPSKKNLCRSSSFSMYYIIFSIDKHRDSNRDLNKRIISLFEDIGEKLHLNKSSILPELFSLMEKEILLKQPGYEYKVKLTVLETIIQILRILCCESDSVIPYRYKKYYEMISDIITFISENVHREITLAELGVRYNLDPRYLNRIFKIITGSPIHKYMLKLRLDEAKKYLVFSTLSLLEISQKLNFSSSQHLSHAFKKAYGLTPSDCRKRNIEHAYDI